MAANIGRGDRIFRIFIGLAFITLGVIFKTWWGIIGIIPLTTALVSFCPLYAALGISTIKVKSPRNDGP